MAKVESSVNSDALDEIEEGFDVEGAYGYTANHAPYVNWETHYAGTRPPFQPIREWVHRKWNDLDEGMKLYALSEDTSKAREIASEITTDEWKDRVAGLVVGAIAKNGTKAVRFMERSMERARGATDAIATPYENSGDPHAPYKILRDFLDFAFGVSQDIVADEATDTGSLLQSGYVDVQEINGELTHYEEGQ